MKQNKLTLACTVITAGVFAPAAAMASAILSPVSVMNSVPENYSGCCAIERTIDQSGLTSNFVSGVTDFDTYFGTAPLHDINFSLEWFAPSGIFTQTIDYNLGGLYLIDRAAVWNEESWGANTVDIFTSIDNITYSSVGSFSLTNHPVAFYSADILNVNDSMAQYVRFIVNGIPGDDGDGSPFNDSVSLGEVAFSVSAVPEPETYAMLLAGLGLLGFAARRRQQNA